MDVDLPSAALREHWDDVVSDLEAAAADLEAAGWSTLSLHAGDVTTRPGDGGTPAGLSVLVPSNDFEQLEALLADGATLDETAVYRSAAGGVVFLVCSLRDPDRQTAVLFPAFFPQRGDAARRLAERAHAAGALDVHVHPLSGDRVVTVTIEDPALVFPRD